MRTLTYLLLLFLILTVWSCDGTSGDDSDDSDSGSDSSFVSSSSSEKICAFNSIGMVPSNKHHTYKCLHKKSDASYTKDDFSVSWHPEKLNHPFFKWLGDEANFKGAYSKMGCQESGKSGFGSVCNYSPSEVDQYYANAFGKEKIYKCKVPKNHFALNVRFVLKLDHFSTSAGGRWSMFGGIYKFTDASQVKSIVSSLGKRIKREVKSTRLDTSNINTHLNIIPEFVQGAVAWAFNSNINSQYVRSVKEQTSYSLADEGYVKILPPGTEFIISRIYNGTTSVKQVCDSFRFDSSDGCGISL